MNKFTLFAIIGLASSSAFADKWTVTNEDQSIKWQAMPSTLMSKGNVNLLLFKVIGPKDDQAEWLFTSTCGLNGGTIKAYEGPQLLDIYAWTRGGGTAFDNIAEIICELASNKDSPKWDAKT
jgi:hypothetical protein